MKRTGRERFLGEMVKVIPWNALVDLIEPHYSKTGSKGDRPLNPHGHHAALPRLPVPSALRTDHPGTRQLRPLLYSLRPHHHPPQPPAPSKSQRSVRWFSASGFREIPHLSAHALGTHSRLLLWS